MKLDTSETGVLSVQKVTFPFVVPLSSFLNCKYKITPIVFQRGIVLREDRLRIISLFLAVTILQGTLQSSSRCLMYATGLWAILLPSQNI